jgi:uncharacterized membrane protein YbhN (UPF0104 family)
MRRVCENRDGIMRKYRNQILLGLMVAVVIYVGLLLVMDSSGQLDEHVIDHLRDFPWLLLIPLAFTQISAGFFRFMAWTYYLGVISARHKIRLTDSLIIFVSSFVFVVSPGKAAELLKSVFLKMKTGTPVTRSAPIVIAERVIDGLAVIIIVLLTLLFAGHKLELGDYETTTRAIIYSSVGLIGFGLMAVQIKPLAYFCLNLIGRIPLIGWLRDPLKDFYESSREIFNLRHVVPMTFVGLGVYLSTSIGFIIVLWGFGFDVTWTLALQATFIVGVVSAIGALSFVPNGAGVSEVSNTVLLIAIVAPAHPELTPELAATISLIQGFFHKWFRALVGLGVAITYRRHLFSADLDAAIADAEAEMEHARHPSELSMAESSPL